MKRLVQAICGFVVFVMLTGAVAAQEAETPPKGVPAGAQQARVWGYIDGGSFKARIGDTTEVITLLGVDAPASDADECFAAESAAHLRDLLPKKATIYLERDRDDKDGRNRLPRFVWIARDGDAKAFLVNTKQVRDGYAMIGAAAPSGRYADNFAKADRQAQDGERGLWGACYAPNGEWVGATAYGDPISFTVTNHGISALAVSLTCADGGGYTTYSGSTTWTVPQPVDRDGFSITTGGSGTTVTLAGSFLSNSEAQGTLELADTAGHCGGLVTVAWYATRQQPG